VDHLTVHPGGSSRVADRLGQRVIYQDLGVTKLDVARYYDAVAEWMVPHLAGRPLTLLPCGESVEELHKTGEYLMADTRRTLVSLAQMGVLEVHTWNAVAEHPHDHDRLIFDLDPGPAVAWREVVSAAKRVRAALKKLGLAAWVKTTGGKGLHVVAPLAPAADVGTCLKFAASIAIGLCAEHPDAYTLSLPRTGRERKILIDIGRNGRTSTAVAAYSLRARAGAPVSTPLAWEELTARLAPARFNVKTLRRRLRRVGDVWAGYRDARDQLPLPT
jgi:bifunctional non-homologous end joining protein LigD